MKISLNASVLSKSYSLEEFLALARQYGCEGADLGLEQIIQLNPDDPVSAGQELFEKYEVYPSAWGLPLEFRSMESDAEYEVSIAQFPQMAKLAADLNCPRMCTWLAPALPDPETFRRVAGRRIKRAAQIAGEYSVRLGLEWVAPKTSRQGAGVQPFIWRMDQMLDWIDEMAEPNLGLLVDSWHWYHAEHTVADLEALSAEQVVHVHINDAPDRPKDTLGDCTDRVMPGEGVIDLPGFVGALKTIGYQDYLSPEVLNPDICENMPDEEAVRQAVEGTRRLLEQVGASG